MTNHTSLLTLSPTQVQTCSYYRMDNPLYHDPWTKWMTLPVASGACTNDAALPRGRAGDGIRQNQMTELISCASTTIRRDESGPRFFGCDMHIVHKKLIYLRGEVNTEYQASQEHIARRLSCTNRSRGLYLESYGVIAS